WQMWEPGREPVSSSRTPWYEALDYPGAFQMKYLKALFLARPFTRMVPNQDLVAKDLLQNTAPARAAIARDNSFAVIYIPHGQDLEVELSMFNNSIVEARWYNPRMGESIMLKK